MTEIGKQLIINDDCLDAMELLADATIDCAITSPPYNIGAKYGTYNDNRPVADYLDTQFRAATALRRVLTPTGSLWLNHGGGRYEDPLLALRVLDTYIRAGFWLQNHIVWVKQAQINFRASRERKKLGQSTGWQTAGQVLEVSSDRYFKRQFEHVFHLVRDEHARPAIVTLNKAALKIPYADKSNATRYGKGDDLTNRGNVWVVQHTTVRSQDGKHNHPAIFPEELVELCLKATAVGAAPLRVLDPFGGVGTVAVVCERLGHEAISIDVDPTYCSTAVARVQAVIDRRYEPPAAVEDEADEPATAPAAEAAEPEPAPIDDPVQQPELPTVEQPVPLAAEPSEPSVAKPAKVRRPRTKRPAPIISNVRAVHDDNPLS